VMAAKKVQMQVHHSGHLYMHLDDGIIEGGWSLDGVVVWLVVQ
jgi:hypothetical protein